MPLHPELAAFLDLVAFGAGEDGAQALHALPVADARARYDAATLALDHPDPALKVDARPLVIDTDGRRIDARVYQPAGQFTNAGPLPVLLFFHGGGYVLGGLDSHDSLCRSLAGLACCAVVAVAYRRAPEHKFPAAYDDAWATYRWLHAHGTGLGLDTTRIAMGGDSVGGSLATALTITAREAGVVPLPTAQALIYPCVSAFQDTPSHRRFAEGYLLEAKTLQWMFASYLNNEEERRDWRFAPLEAGDLSGLPPTWVAVAEYDPLVDEGSAYAARLQSAGVTATLKIYDGMVHDFARLGGVVPAEAQQLRHDTADFLRAAFATTRR